MKFELLLILSLTRILVESCKSRDTSLSINIEKNDGILTRILESLGLRNKKNHLPPDYNDGYRYHVPATYPLPYEIPAVYYPYDDSYSACPSCYPALPSDNFPSYHDVPSAHPTTNTQTNAQSPPTHVYVIPPPRRVDTPSYQPRPRVPPTSNQNWNSFKPTYYTPSRIPVTDAVRPQRPITETPQPSISFHSRTPVNPHLSPSSASGSSWGTRTRVTYESVDICRGKVCKSGHRCEVKQEENCPSRNCKPIAVCTDPCEMVRCAEDQVCRVATEPCGSSYCEPVARCQNMCDGIACPSNLTCSPVTLSCDGSSCKRVPVCGGDPCVDHACPRGEGCQAESSCNDFMCEIRPVCRDPCENVKCRGDEHCYVEQVSCTKAPCNPVPVCENPCHHLQCKQDEECVLEEVHCDRPRCTPVPVCKPSYSGVITRY